MHTSPGTTLAVVQIPSVSNLYIRPVQLQARDIHIFHSNACSLSACARRGRPSTELQNLQLNFQNLKFRTSASRSTERSPQ